MNEYIEIQKLAEDQIDRNFKYYYTNSEKNNIITAAFSSEQLIDVVFDKNIEIHPNIYKLTLEYLESFRLHNNSEITSDYALHLPNGIVNRNVLVGLAAAAIGASMGLAGKDLHPLLSSIVSAEAAVLLNLLSALVLDPKIRTKKIDGLDLAVLSIFDNGNFNTEEVNNRLSKNLDESEIKKCINKLLKLKLIQKGRWKNTYTITKLGKSYL